MLARAFCPNIKERMNLIPLFKNPTDNNLISYSITDHPYDWESIYTNKNSENKNKEVR